jgi:hypothetical protein
MRTYSDAIHWEFLNWARWNYEGDMPGPGAIRCGSIESRYVPPVWGGESGPSFIPADSDRAKLIDRIYKQHFTQLQRLCVMAEYTQRQSSGRYESVDLAARWVSQRVGSRITADDYDAQLAAAASKIWLVIERKAAA